MWPNPFDTALVSIERGSASLQTQPTPCLGGSEPFIRWRARLKDQPTRVYFWTGIRLMYPRFTCDEREIEKNIRSQKFFFKTQIFKLLYLLEQYCFRILLCSCIMKREKNIRKTFFFMKFQSSQKVVFPPTVGPMGCGVTNAKNEVLKIKGDPVHSKSIFIFYASCAT